MYELKRSNKITEQIKLGDEIIDVNVDIDEIAQKFKAAYVELAQAETALNTAKTGETETTTNALETYGKALITLLQTVFGEDTTVKILEFYENRYIELSYEILPFIVNVILPAINNAATERKEKLNKLYTDSQHLNRAQRRKLGL
jgi:hypothetical protein